MSKSFDKYFINKTEEAAELKDATWTRIEAELIRTGEFNKQVKKKSKHKWIGFAAAAILALGIVGFGFYQTDVGYALYKDIKEMFVPEKDVNFQIEGHDEEQTVVIKEGDNQKYVLYVDETRYTTTKENGTDVLKMHEQPEGYPIVSMEVQYIGKASETVLEEIKATVSDDFTFKREEQLDQPHKGMKLVYTNGDEWNSEVQTFTILNHPDGGSVLAHQRYFVEAFEGHGARFDQMLNELEYVE